MTRERTCLLATLFLLLHRLQYWDYRHSPSIDSQFTMTTYWFPVGVNKNSARKMLVQWRLERWVVGGGRGIRASTSVLYSGSRSPLITFPRRRDSNGRRKSGKTEQTSTFLSPLPSFHLSSSSAESGAHAASSLLFLCLPVRQTSCQQALCYTDICIRPLTSHQSRNGGHQRKNFEHCIQQWFML